MFQSVDSQLPPKWSMSEHHLCPQTKGKDSRPWLLAKGTMEASTEISTEVRAEVRAELLSLNSQGLTTSGTSSSGCSEGLPEEDQIRQLAQFVSTARKWVTSPRIVLSPPRSRKLILSELQLFLSHFCLSFRNCLCSINFNKLFFS